MYGHPLANPQGACVGMGWDAEIEDEEADAGDDAGDTDGRGITVGAGLAAGAQATTRRPTMILVLNRRSGEGITSSPGADRDEETS